MIELIRKLSSIFTPGEKLVILALCAMMLVSAALEIVGIGLVMPVIALLSKPELIEQNKYLSLAKSVVNPPSNERFILVLCLVLAAFFIAKNAFLAFQNFLQSRFIFNKSSRISERLYANYIHAPYKFHLEQNSGRLIGLLTLSSSICHAMLMPMMVLLTESAAILFILAMLLALAPAETIILALAVGLLAASTYYPLRGWNSRLGETNAKESVLASKFELQGLKAVKESKLRNAEDFFCRQRSIHLRARNNAQAMMSFSGNLPRFLIESIVAVLGFGALAALVATGKALGSIPLILSLFAVSLVRIMPSLSRIQYSLSTIRQGQAIFQPLYNELSFFEREDKSPKRPDLPFHSKIALEAVSFRYSEDGPDIVRDFNLEIPRNSSVAFVGPTGCGKTTLVDIILGLLKPSSGRVLCDGVNIEENLPAWQTRIGYVPQSIFLLDDSIKANVAFGVLEDQIDEARVRECLATAQILDFADSLPNGIDTLVGENGIRLSGGQRQRVGIARALYHKPEILVLDEATSALDNDTERAFVDALKALHGKLTIIMVAHRLSTVENCDRVVRL